MIILCNGMMRSGSTLQYNIVKGLLEKNHKSYVSLGFYDKDKIENNFNDLELKSKEQDLIYLIKSHDYSKLNQLKNVRVIYSYRNLMDVAASIKRKFEKKGSSLIAELELSIINYNQIYSSKNLLVQPYEELINSLRACIEEINDFIDLEKKDSIINKVLYDNSPEIILKTQNKNKNIKSFKSFLFRKSMSLTKVTKNVIVGILGREKINMIKNKLLPHDKDTLLHVNHMSQNAGKDGNWINILEKEEVNLIQEKFSIWLEKLN